MIDAAVSERHMWDHIGPVLRALEPSERGVCYLRDQRTHPLEPEIGELMEVRHGIRDRKQTDTPLLCASWGDAQPEKRRLVVMMEHGHGARYGDGPLSIGYVGGHGRERVCLFLDPNDHARGLHAERYPQTPGVVIGQPMLDDVVREPDERTVVLTGHWSNGLSPAAQSAWPAFWDQPEVFRHALALMRADGWTVLGHAHPRAWVKAPNFGQAWERFGVEPLADFAEVLRRATVLVADNTSASFLTAAVGVRQVFLDGPDYSIGYRRGYWPRFALPLDAISSPAELADAVRTATVPDVREVVPWVGGAAARAVDAIREHVLRRQV